LFVPLIGHLTTLIALAPHALRYWIAALLFTSDNRAEEYRGLAIRAKDRNERESYERIVELYVEIAEELEALIDRWASP
jgi:hypothetical protein